MPATPDDLPALIADLASLFLESHLKEHRAALVRKLGRNLVERHLLDRHFDEAIAQVRPQMLAFVTAVLAPILAQAQALAAQHAASPTRSE